MPKAELNAGSTMRLGSRSYGSMLGLQTLTDTPQKKTGAPSGSRTDTQ